MFFFQMHKFNFVSVPCSFKYNEYTFAKGSYVVVLGHLRLCQWHIFCTKSDFQNASLSFSQMFKVFRTDFSRCPGFPQKNHGNPIRRNALKNVKLIPAYVVMNVQFRTQEQVGRKFSLRPNVDCRTRVSRLLSTVVNILLQCILTCTTYNLYSTKKKYSYKE